MFVRDATLWAVAFDSSRLEVVGTPQPVLEDAGIGNNDGNYDVAENGTLIYTPSLATRRKLVWVDRQGREEPLPTPPSGYLYPRISPDGKRVVLDIRDHRDLGDIWLLDLERSSLTRIIDRGNDRHPVWAPDGQHILFASDHDGKSHIYSQVLDRTGSPELLMQNEATNVHFPQSFSRDGTRLILRQMGANWNVKLFSRPERRAEPLIASELPDTNGEISPDGKWLAYESGPDVRKEIYVHPFPDVQKRRWQISTNGGSEPLWARSGRELFYVGLDGRLMVTRVQTSPSFVASPPARLLNTAYLSHSVVTPGRTYDISPDGSRFLMIKEGDAELGGRQIVVVLNWAAALKN